MQADGRRELAAIFGRGNRGDSDDLFPHNGNNSVAEDTKPPLNLPGGRFSGVSIAVRGNPGDDRMTVDVTFA